MISGSPVKALMCIGIVTLILQPTNAYYIRSDPFLQIFGPIPKRHLPSIQHTTPYQPESVPTAPMPDCQFGGSDCLVGGKQGKRSDDQWIMDLIMYVKQLENENKADMNSRSEIL